jgi:hypothetical protein
MNLGLVEARELAARMAESLRAGGTAAGLQEWATRTQGAWQRLLGGREVRALPGADPWVRDARTRIAACLPASGDDHESLLRQVGLTAA